MPDPLDPATYPNLRGAVTLDQFVEYAARCGCPLPRNTLKAAVALYRHGARQADVPRRVPAPAYRPPGYERAPSLWVIRDVDRWIRAEGGEPDPSIEFPYLRHVMAVADIAAYSTAAGLPITPQGVRNALARRRAGQPGSALPDPAFTWPDRTQSTVLWEYAQIAAWVRLRRQMRGLPPDFR